MLTCIGRDVQNRLSEHIQAQSAQGELGLRERQRVKTWLKNTYAIFDRLPV